MIELWPPALPGRGPAPATGEPAGHTVVAVDTERPELAHQHDTAVVRGHRGHRLGLLLKAEMMRWLAEAEPQVDRDRHLERRVQRHMIAVNERLGYRRSAGVAGVPAGR